MSVRASTAARATAISRYLNHFTVSKRGEIRPTTLSAAARSRMRAVFCRGLIRLLDSAAFLAAASSFSRSSLLLWTGKEPSGGKSDATGACRRLRRPPLLVCSSPLAAAAAAASFSRSSLLLWMGKASSEGKAVSVSNVEELARLRAATLGSGLARASALARSRALR